MPPLPDPEQDYGPVHEVETGLPLLRILREAGRTFADLIRLHQEPRDGEAPR